MSEDAAAFGELRSLLQGGKPGAVTLTRVGKVMERHAMTHPQEVEEQWMPYIEDQLSTWPVSKLSVPVTRTLFAIPQRVRTFLIAQCARVDDRFTRFLDEHLVKLLDAEQVSALSKDEFEVLSAWIVDARLDNDPWLELALEHFSESDIHDGGEDPQGAYNAYSSRCDEARGTLASYAEAISGYPRTIFSGQMMAHEQDDGVLIAKVGDQVTELIAHRRFADRFNTTFGTSHAPLDIVATFYPGEQSFEHAESPAHTLSESWFESEQMKAWHAQFCMQARRLAFYDYDSGGRHVGGLMGSGAKAWSEQESISARRTRLAEIAASIEHGYSSVDLYDMFTVHDGGFEFDEEEDEEIVRWFHRFGEAYIGEMKARAVALTRALAG